MQLEVFGLLLHVLFSVSQTTSHSIHKLERLVIKPKHHHTQQHYHMGLRMDDLHAPTIPSGPSSQPTTNGTSKKQSLQELSAQKENLEAELSALGSVLDSVRFERALKETFVFVTNGFPSAWREHEHRPYYTRRLSASRHRRCANPHHKSEDRATAE